MLKPSIGVKASPRVVNVASAGTKAKRLPRGGGRAQVGKPYKVRGKWYTPRLDPNYQAAGTASWYGDAFHGRLTANGEIYDMNHLSAAHPTMPLPSYARVTNLKNGNSVIVRVNDRGPYAHNRLVDLSKRAAQLLDYTNSGTAQVKLEYVGPAPVNGADDEYLMASYQPGNGGGQTPIGEQPVMVAMAETTADPSLPGVNAFADDIPSGDGQVEDGQVSVAAQLPETVRQPRSDLARAPVLETMSAGDMPVVPTFAPTPSERPESCVTLEPCEDIALKGMVNGYASEHFKSGHAAQAFRSMQLDADREAGWKKAEASERILIGTFDAGAAAKAKQGIGKLGIVTVESNEDGTVELFATPKSGRSTDSLLKVLWRSGYQDAFVLR